MLKGWTPTTLVVNLGSEFSLSLNVLLCKIGMTALPGETNLNGPSARPGRHPAGALTSSARPSAGLGAQAVWSLGWEGPGHGGESGAPDP